MTGTAQEIRRRPGLDESPRVHHGDVLAEFAHDREVVADEDDRQIELDAQLVDQVEDLRLDRDVERGRRFVAEQYRRFGGERHGDGDALAHAAGELVGVRVEASSGVRNTDQTEQFDRAST